MFNFITLAITGMVAFTAGMLGGFCMSTFVTKAKVAALLADLDAKDKKIGELEQAVVDARESVEDAVDQATSALKDQIKIRDDHINVLEAKLAEESEELQEINDAIDARRNPPVATDSTSDTQPVDASHPVDAAPAVSTTTTN